LRVSRKSGLCLPNLARGEGARSAFQSIHRIARKERGRGKKTWRNAPAESGGSERVFGVDVTWFERGEGLDFRAGKVLRLSKERNQKRKRQQKF